MTNALGVVIVAWNSGGSLESCVRRLRASAELAGETLEMVIVDNGSRDGSVGEARLGELTVIENAVNAGFGVAASQGLSVGTADWVLLLNPDVVVDVGFVGGVLRAARAAPPEVSTLVPDVRFASAPDVVNCRGIAVDDIGIPCELESGRQARPLDGVRRVFGGSTGCVVYRRAALAAVGGLEPAYFAYLEDVDVAWRLNRAGFTAVLVPAALAFHEVSASTGQSSPTKAYLVARSRRLLFALNGPRTVRARALRSLVELGHAVITGLSGAGTAPLRGRASAVRARRYVSFVRRSRDLDSVRASPPLLPRVTLRETLARKRRVSTHASRGSDGTTEGAD